MTDKAGNTWTPDQQYTQGGWGYTAPGNTYSTSQQIHNTDDPELYKYLRYAPALDYKFDGLATGNYRVTLYFAEPYWSTAGNRVFSVAVQGTTLISNLDVVADAGAAFTADVKDVVAHVDNGQLDIQLTASKDNAMVNAIEIQPTTDPVTLPPVPSVTASIVSDAYVTKGTQVTLTAIPQATIYYTEDGSDPRTASTRAQYTGPVTINNDVVIKAYATAPNMADSDVSTFTYMIRPAPEPAPSVGPAGRQELNLSGTGWRAWMDTSASWQADRLYLPEQVYIPKMPANPPTGGWSVLNDTNGKGVSLPTTVEQAFSNGDPTWTYHGVTWFWNNHVAIPGSWAGKTVIVGLDRARVRAEIYVNGTLAGYNMVPDTPYKADVSRYLHYGADNTIAIRITNPGGSRSWYDGLTGWGQYAIPSRDDYGDVGNVSLAATNNVYVDDVFVENRPPASSKTVEIHASVKSKMASDMPLKMSVAISSARGGPAIYSNSWQVTARALSKSDITEPITVPQASLWSPATPNLYDATVTISGGGVADTLTQRFGFRDFEVRNGNYYLNGKRFVLKSAIEMGYYAGTGDIATPIMAAKSVGAAKAIGHNGIQMHRHIGDPLILRDADEYGLFIYEEPGDFHGLDNDGSFASRLMLDKIQRMAMRDRNHPSLIIVNLSNEDNTWNGLREQAMNLVHGIDPSIMVTNTSGANGPPINNIVPYGTAINSNYFDDHPLASSSRFTEDSFSKYDHFNANVDESKDAYFMGEVAPYTGPANWYLLGQNAATGTDNQLYQSMHDKILAYFNDNRLNSTGNGDVKSPADVTMEAGRGKAYSDGRVEQSLLLDNGLDGFAMNAWSEGPLTYENSAGWTSGLTDAGKNLKAPADDYAYWNRDLQVVIQRTNGKYFTPGQPARFRVGLINEGRLPAGDYTLTLETYDGNGKPAGDATSRIVSVAGGDTFAQTFMDSFTVVPGPEWAGGYLTIEGKLYNGSREVANGKEQVLLQNRPSFGDKMSALRGAVYGWDAAKTAITDTGAAVDDYSTALGKLDYMAVGGTLPDSAVLDNMLTRVHNDGTRMLVKLDQNWADALYNRGILSQKVTSWGGTQNNNSWWSNGWGYLDYFVGNQAVPGGSTISTNGWEVPEDPNAFYPFTSKYPQSAYGAYLAWPDTLRVQIGTVKYGNGTIVLDATYPVDDNNAFSDMLFYNLLTMNMKWGA